MRRATFYDGLSLGLLLGVGISLFSQTTPKIASPYFLARVNAPTRRPADANRVYSAETEPRYEAVDIGVPEGAFGIEAKAVSLDGRTIAGTIGTRTGMRAFLWKNGKFTILSAQDSIAWSVNNSGKAVGEIIVDSVTSRAVQWNKGKAQPLFEDKASSFALHIGKDGTIYGIRVAPEAGHVWRVFVRNTDGSTIYLDDAPQQNSFFRAANAKKQVVFTVSARGSRDGKDAKAVVWEKGKTQELARLKKDQPCRPQAISSTGIVVGMCGLDRATNMPVMWKNYKPALLPTPKLDGGAALGINKKGDVIGTARLQNSGSGIAFLVHNGHFYDLKTLIINGVSIERPVQIADTGVILAEGYVGKVKHTFLLKNK